jgi:hypothetical protein
MVMLEFDEDDEEESMLSKRFEWILMLLRMRS